MDWLEKSKVAYKASGYSELAVPKKLRAWGILCNTICYRYNKRIYDTTNTRSTKFIKGTNKFTWIDESNFTA